MPTPLICLPFAGAGTSYYHGWRPLCGDRFDIRPGLLPGRERRIDVAPLRDVHAAVDDLLPTLAGAGEVVLFGHCLGALIAFELAHRLVEEPDVTVAALIVSGAAAPGEARSLGATGLPDDAFLDRVAEFAGVADDAMTDPELRELILPTLRADVEMFEHYLPGTSELLPVPITAVVGRDDALVPLGKAAGWSTSTSKDFTLHDLPGGHMYLTDSVERVLSLIDVTVHGKGSGGPLI
ncbi:thioesterase [Micromonospora arborensis]|uniref:Thioesterase n=1 Tax=Micromonospora arborensis TaxID=2116518 RepID=A0A318NJ67_9ACTN|nr:alpha/beta fold hydrolase [Micromonospora arborensis]PYC69273.1 thioesterase [Micromonospora arborensis]